MSDPIMNEIRRTLSAASLVAGPGARPTNAERFDIQSAMERIGRDGYRWLWTCMAHIDRLTAELRQVQDHRTVLATELVDEKSGKANTTLREEAGKLREAVRDLRSEVNCRLEHGVTGKAGEHLKYVQDRLDAALGETPCEPR